MKTRNNKAVVVLMTAALLLTSLLPTGCVSRKNKDMVALQSRIEEFIDKFSSGDNNAIEDLVDGRFDYQISSAKNSELLLKIASKSGIEEYENFEIDRKAGKAKVRAKISYIEIGKFGRDKENRNLTKEEYLEKIDSYKERSTAHFTFNFVLDDGDWLIKDISAERYEKLFNRPYSLSVQLISKDQAKKACLDVFDKLAKGEFKQQSFTYNTDELMAFNTWGRTEPVIMDAVTDFAKEYFSFIVSNGLTVEETKNTMQYKVTGYAPSKEALLSYLASDEYTITTCKATIRAEIAKNDQTRQAVWDAYIAEIYTDLTKQIPNLMGEEYSAILKVNATGDKVSITVRGSLFNITTDDIFAAPKYDYSKEKACRKKAIQALYEAGELTRVQYDKYMSEYRNDGGNDTGRPTPTPTTTDTTSNTTKRNGTGWYPNQAVNVKEETPDWSNGNLVYGTSDPDKNGISMLYSKEPGWLNTAGYNISDDSITVMVKHDKKLAKGTELEFDWDINGSTQQYGVPFVVPEDGADEFFFTIPAKLLYSGNTAEFRLWEKGHAHVIAYVKLTKT